jgi:hypothetical protein
MKQRLALLNQQIVRSARSDHLVVPRMSNDALTDKLL